MRGSVVQKPRGSGRWYVVRDADRGLARLLSDLDQGAYLAPQKLTLRQFLSEIWLPAIESTVRESTFNGYRSHVRLYIAPALAQRPRRTPIDATARPAA